MTKLDEKLDDKHLEQLKKLLADLYSLDVSSVLVEFDKNGQMVVTAKKRGE